MKRNTYYAIAASVLIFCTIINYGMSNLESTGGTRSHSGGTILRQLGLFLLLIHVLRLLEALLPSSLIFLEFQT